MRVVLVTGGRKFASRSAVFVALDAEHNDVGISLLIHGACTDPETRELSGADRWAEEWAIYRQVPYLGVPAEWTKLGRSAGPRRNRRMPQMAEAFGVPVSLVIACPGGSGTSDMVGYAEGLNIPVRHIR